MSSPSKTRKESQADSKAPATPRKKDDPFRDDDSDPEVYQDAVRRAVLTKTMTTMEIPSRSHMFDGSQDYVTWKRGTKIRLTLDGTTGVEAAKAVFRKLDGTALDQVLGRITDEDFKFTGPDQVFGILDETYVATAVNQVDIRRQLTRLRQGTTPLEEHLQSFNRLAAAAALDPTDALGMLQGTINQRIMTIAAAYVGTSMSEFVTVCKRADAMAPKVLAKTPGYRGRKEKGRGVREAPDISTIECYKCHKKGHYKRDCKEKGRTARKTTEPEETDPDPDYESFGAEN